MKNDELEPSVLSSSYSKRPQYVNLAHNDHNEDQYLHHDQQTEQPEERSVAREQQDEQPKNVQPRPKKPARVQHPKDVSPHYEPQQEHPSVEHKGDEQAAEHGDAQTHHEAESRSHTCDEDQEQPFVPCMTDKWQEIIEDQECQSDSKQQRADRREMPHTCLPEESRTCESDL
jgi:hypothetical protein